ncbi:kelch repeat protein, putative [Ricinus communis]|uniref:Kelch repeat protein, putative n=1 Tax=Ricinus communis TaxID=3988 RepID=B9RLL7_RICCO|nr:kelch repeat protein, putative [Ricinus communis]
MRWERLQQQQQSSNINNGPGKRWGHTCNSVKGGRFLYVFGGYGKDNCQTNQVHVFDTATQTWSQPVIKGTPPTPRDSHSCTTVGDSLYVFGGTDGMNPLKDLHILDTLSHTWIAPAVRGEGPEAREGHSAALVGKRLFIFGGCGKSSNNNDEVYFNDLYILNTETFVWKKAVTSGTPPSARDSHTCSSWKNKIIVIGGEDGHDYYLSDVHILDAETLVWKELNATGQKLPPRAGHSTVSFGKNLFVFGGFTDAQNLYDDLYMLDVDTGVWTKIMTAGIGPSARFSVAGDCLDPQIGGVLVFIGGCNKSLEALDDMYYLYTGLARIRDELRLEKLSLRKQLKLKCQEQNLNSPVHDKALLRIDTSRENLRLNQVQLHQGKKTFQAKVTECFPHGYTIETIIDGKPLHGILFANKPISSPMASQSNSRKRVSAEIGPLLNSDHNNKSKTSKALKQDGVDHLQPDNVHGKETLMHESKPEADAKNLPSDVSQLYEVPSNLEPSVAPLNLNDDMISDAPNSDTGFAKEFFTPAKESITLSIKQDNRILTAGVGNEPAKSL